MSSIYHLKLRKKSHRVLIHVYSDTLHLPGKFGALFASIPLPIFAAIYCVLFGIVGE
jgi:nucleobase transporter 1/2